MSPETVTGLVNAAEQYIAAVKGVFKIDPRTKQNFCMGSPTKDQETYERFMALNDTGKLLSAAIAKINAPVGFDTPSTGWASPTLGRAYYEIERLRDDLAQPPENGIGESLTRALEAIEAADCELTGIAS